MAWLPALRAHFPSGVIERGRAYVSRVRLLDRQGGGVHAHVAGTEDYCVRVGLARRALEVSCTCPYFESTGLCKHVWAVLEVSSQLGAFHEAGRTPSLIEVEPVPHARFPGRSHAVRAAAKAKARVPDWRGALEELPGVDEPTWRLPVDAEIVYIIDAATTRLGHGTQVEIAYRHKKLDGQWSRPRPLAMPARAISTLLDPRDRELLSVLSTLSMARTYYSANAELQTKITLDANASAVLVEKLCATGRAWLRDRSDAGTFLEPCVWDDGPPYVLRLVVTPTADGTELRVRGELHRGEEVRALGEHLLLLSSGIAFFKDRVARLATSRAEFRWIPFLLQRGGELRVPAADGDALAIALAALPHTPEVALPEALRIEERQARPRPSLQLRSQERRVYSDALRATLRFDYEGVLVEEGDERARVPGGPRLVLVRDPAFERTCRARLLAVGVRETPDRLQLTLPPARLPELVATLAAEGWRIESDGKTFREHGAISVVVKSGIDWFDLEADVAYAGERVALPRLLAAVKRGEHFVTLADGSLGILPAAWLAQHRLLGALGATHEDAVRFRRAQVGVLDALLSAMPEAKVDQTFARAREALASWKGITTTTAPPGFVGALRGYQREGLAWLEFLRDFGFGGCLADDMGLGKTIQVLALLERRRTTRERGRPRASLVVVPKSLVFNWRREAERFTPKLRLLEHHGPARARAIEALTDHDVIVTTYGTLVRDIELFRTLDVDYAILDEAQAIKNPGTEAAKAARLLPARHRLALTGTPVENRLGDLWSLFEFLNPGMLGAGSAFKQLGLADGDLAAGDGSRALLARALRPFILRRTKERVAPDLPAKTEQIIYCELEGDERKRYDELRAHYRASLLGLVDESGVGRAQMHILEALLRLRQAACHPGLIDRAQASGPSAKLTALLAQLEDVVAGGYKALVFSQFTALLGIVRGHLDVAGIKYEYLDGKTRDRQRRVDRFQSDPDCQVFLVSLKAGGVGLNLTAAEYVFLLDPWWNPAVEAQAIDRTHRIGQARPVFAYRLVGRDTIEEKVLALQDQKRALAEAVINADNALLTKIGREELELLLS